MSDELQAGFDRGIRGAPSEDPVSEDSATRAELLFLLRLVFADGDLSSEATRQLGRIASSALAIQQDAIDEIVREIGGPINPSQAARAFRSFDIEHRKYLARRLSRIAAADAELSRRKDHFTGRVLEILDLSPEDLTGPQAA